MGNYLNRRCTDCILEEDISRGQVLAERNGDFGSGRVLGMIRTLGLRIL